MSISAAEDQAKFYDVFKRWRQALVRVDEAEKYRAEARAELDSIEGELRALARKGGS